MAPDIAEYTIAIVCALPLEMAATRAMLDEEYEAPISQDKNDKNNYTLGRIGKHPVVIACLPDGIYGMTAATSLITWMLSSYKSIQFGVIVGIGAGVPSTTHDIRLGDVVVSKPRGSSPGIIQYDFGKAINGNIIPNGSLDKPPKVLLTAMSSLVSSHMMTGSKIFSHISAMLDTYPTMQERFRYPGSDKDLLYEADYNHIAGALTCCQCEPKKLVSRPPRPHTEPAIFYGTIGSGNLVIKDGLTRDRLANQHNIICFEMEAAGLVSQLPCLVVRGICDYADSHKNKIWQEYAAAAAAAYAKELLCAVPASTYDISVSVGSPKMVNIICRSVTSSTSSTTSQDTLQISPIESQTPPSASFILTDRFHPKDSISLASLVPDRRYPNQDAFADPQISLKQGQDFSVSIDYNFNEFVGVRAKSSSVFKRALGKLFLPPSIKGVEGDIQVLSEESSVYTVLQPRALFQQLSRTSEFRKWLDIACASKKQIYFIVGYRTVTNAQFVGKEIKSPRSRRLQPGVGNATRYNTSGERIYAVCFRRVKFEQSDKGNGGGLDSTNKWRVFSKHRGTNAELEQFISADISDDDEEGTCQFGVFPRRDGEEEVWTGF
ncbi:hypothetical protein TWF173_003008 [Orbilia oligospora]|nr:hypothetical protein TWF173_003008 [Orbilia oligospora]